MAIKILMTLDGSAQVKQALDDAGKAVDQFVDHTKSLSADTGKPIVEFTDSLKTAKPAIEEVTTASKSFHEILQVLHPILRASGVEVQGLAGFSRLASAGIVGLGGAITGVLVVALATLEEQEKKTKVALDGLLGAKGTSAQAFDEIAAAAKRLGIATEDLAPSFLAAKRALDQFQQSSGRGKAVAPPGQDLLPAFANIDNVSKSVENLFKIIRAGGQDSAQAKTTTEAFFKALQDGGILTAQIINQLPDGAIRLLGEAFGKGTQSVAQTRAELALMQPTIVKVIEALAKFGPQAQKAFDEKAVKGFRDAFEEMLRDVGKDFRDVFGVGFSDFLVQSIKDFSRDVKTIIEDIKAGIAFVKAAAAPAGGAPVREQAKLEAQQLTTVQPFKLSDLFGTAPQPQLPLDAFGSLSGAVEKVNDKIEEDTKQTTDAVEQDWQLAAENINQSLESPIDLSAQQNAFQTLFDTVLARFNAMLEQMRAAAANPIMLNIQNSAGGGTLPLFMAGGGMISGPGSGTSDSIMAFLSNREFVMNSRAVSFYGSGFMHAINSMLLPRAMPRFADGGQVNTPDRNVTIVLDGRQFGLSGSQSTIESLEREASLRALARIGPAPTFVR